MTTGKHLYQFARKYPLLILLSVFLGVFGAVFNGVGTTLIIPAVFQSLGASAAREMSVPPLIAQLIEPFNSAPQKWRGVIMLGIIFLAILLKNISNYLSLVMGEALVRSLTKDMRQAGLAVLLGVDLDYHHKMRTGDIIQRLNDQVGRSVASISNFINLVRALLNISLLAVILLALSWQLSILSAAFLLIVTQLNHSVVARSKGLGVILSEASRDYSIKVLETLSGIRLIKASASEEREYEAAQRYIEARERAAMEAQINSALVGPLNEVLSTLSLIAIIFLGRFILPQDSLGSTTSVLTFLFVLSRIMPYLGQLNVARDRLASNSASVELVHDFLRRDNKTFMTNGSYPFAGLRQAIHFRSVGFRYPGTNDQVLKDIDLKLPKGKTLALVGASGAGKSTLADLLPRFYDPTEGQITIDGIDLREFDIASVRRCMGIVSQDTFLFNASVRDNIAYARPDASDDEVIQAAIRANAYEFIMQLPLQFGTPLGDRGVLLSGGQRQRIAIARALLQNPDILILDEATSALDSDSEMLVQTAIEELSRERTTLVIAHRLSTIRNADQIAVLDQGRVVETGTHAQLLRWQGHYARLCDIQFAQPDRSEAQNRRAVAASSHKMRTGLTTIMGTLQMLMDSGEDNCTEPQTLLQETYQAAVNLLPAIEALEQSHQSTDTSMMTFSQASPEPQNR